jgi:hypothetical protein
LAELQRSLYRFVSDYLIGREHLLLDHAACFIVDWSYDVCVFAVASFAGMADYLEKSISKELMKGTIERFIPPQERDLEASAA